MAQINDVSDHGLEVLKKSAIVPDDTYKTRYAVRTQPLDGSGNPLELDVSGNLKVTLGTSTVNVTDDRMTFTGSDLNVIDDRLVINSSGQLKVVLDGKVDTNNTTKANLLANNTFTGVASETLDYAIIFVTVHSNVASATDGLKIQFSSDGTTWRDGDVYTVGANTEETFSCNPYRKYYRVVYVNGSTNQTTFDLECILKKMNSKPSSHRVQDMISNDDDGELVKSVIAAENTASPGTFLNIKSTTGGNLRVTVDQVEPTTNSLKTIDYAHAELHAGDHFVTKSFVTIAKNASYDLLLVTPDTTKWAHVIREYEALSSVCIVYLYEGTTTSNNGTTVPIYNRNRNSIKTNTTLVYHTPTVTGIGTLISSIVVGVARNVGGVNRDSTELILKQNTKYLIRITEQNVVATNVNILIDWYEHTNA